jgi:hypothetical protein
LAFLEVICARERSANLARPASFQKLGESLQGNSEHLPRRHA